MAGVLVEVEEEEGRVVCKLTPMPTRPCYVSRGDQEVYNNGYGSGAAGSGMSALLHVKRGPEGGFGRGTGGRGNGLQTDTIADQA